jgi:transposase
MLLVKLRNDHPAREYTQVSGNGSRPAYNSRMLIWSILHGNMQQFRRERVKINELYRILSTKGFIRAILCRKLSKR